VLNSLSVGLLPWGIVVLVIVLAYKLVIARVVQQAKTEMIFLDRLTGTLIIKGGGNPGGTKEPPAMDPADQDALPDGNEPDTPRQGSCSAPE
jgi:hypothetical protein